MKNVWRVYIKPFDTSGDYTSYQEVTKDVDFNSLGTIDFNLDNTTFDIGVFRSSTFTLRLRNSEGKYSDVDQDHSIFSFTRANSLVKITHSFEEDDEPICGLAICGEAYLSDETTIFEGLLNDDSLVQNLRDQFVSFTCIGREDILNRVAVNFSSINDGDLASEVMYTILNQTAITTLLGVSASNINPDNDIEIDDVAPFENKTVRDVLADLLLATNSVLYIESDSIVISSREAGSTSVKTFYGQGSPNGIESILSIENIKNGLNRTFNYLTWTSTSLVSSDAASISKYGVKKKSVAFDFITDSTTKSTILSTIRAEFESPKQEMDLITPFDPNVFEDVNLLDRVSIDYPRIYDETIFPVPICGEAILGEAVLPDFLWSFTILDTDPYKVIGRSIDLKNSTLKYKVRFI